MDAQTEDPLAETCKRLRAERDQILALLQALPDISFVIDEDGLYVQVMGGSNRAMYADGQALVGYTLHQALSARLADQCLEQVRAALHTGNLQTFEYTLRLTDLTRLPNTSRSHLGDSTDQCFEARILPLSTFAHAKPVVLCVAVNITPRKRIEEYWREMARTDPLTGIANRQWLLERAHEEITRARRYGHPLALLMMDVDHFKRVNDHFGHAVGDQVLSALTAASAAVLRDTDLIGRTGGEEFVVLLPETDHKGARQLGQRLLAAARQITFPEPYPHLKLTISIGCVVLHGTDDLDTLMHRADRLLYAAKDAGRDQLHSEPI